MSKLPVVTAREVVRALQKLGFHIDRQRGSHIVLADNDHTVTVPFHSGDVPKGTLRSIIRQSGVNRDEFLKAL